MKKILIINNGTIHLEKLRSLLSSEITVVDYSEISLRQAKSFDLIILTGSSTFPVLGNESLFAHEIEIIRTLEKPIIGICFGCELIASAFGATLKNLGEKRHGLIEITATSSKENILEANRLFSVYEGHTWAIDSLPEESFDILARSADGPEIIKHCTLPLWGFQFHPENMTDTTMGDEIFLRVIKKYI